MNIFKMRNMPWWETGLIKWSSLLVGVAAGAYWADIFAPYAITIASAGIALGIVAAFFWSRE